MSVPNFWNQQHPLYNQYETLYHRLVPSYGSADSEEGEMLRAASKLGYDYYNNGMCNNVSGAAKYLIERFKEYDLGCLDELNILYAFSNNAGPFSTDLDPLITTVIAKLVEYIISVNGVYLATADDMFDWQDPDRAPMDYDDHDDRWDD